LKNFPNQINDLNKLTAALGVASVFIGAGGTLHDEPGFGTALSNQNVVASINQNSLEATARGLRRFFELAGLINSEWTAVTPRGNDLLAAGGNISLRNLLWREAMFQLKLPDNLGQHISHPYRTMMRLVADKPGIETIKLLLALEPRDDSAAEYARVLALAGLPTGDIIAQLGISGYTAQNAIKILPGIGVQVGDIVRTGNRVFPVSHKGATEDSLIEEGEPEYAKSQPSALVAVDADNISPLPDFGDTVPSPVDLSAAIAIRKRRTIEHHTAVVSIAKILGSNGYTLYKDPFDCLGFKIAVGAILIEMKTLDGSRSDERSQCERALGQLRGYNYFNIPAEKKDPKLIEIAAYTGRPSADIIDFMRNNKIYSAWPQDDQWLAADLGGNIANFSPDDLLAN
jgi:hypothetical protein